MQYPIAIEWGDDTTAIGIQIPGIPGAVTAGDTFEAAHRSWPMRRWKNVGRFERGLKAAGLMEYIAPTNPRQTAGH